MKRSQTVEIKVGELSRRTGMSVRTLHHYDEIGLLSPARRTASGHRLYGTAEIRRLQRIASLRQLGFSLDEIRSCLDQPAFTLERVLDLHIARLEAAIEGQRRLRRRLAELAERLRAAEEISADELLRTIEVTTMFEKYYSPDQLDYLEKRKEQVGEEAIQAAQTAWAELFTGFERALNEGADPASEDVQALAREAMGLIQQFTGGDPGVERSLGSMVGENRESMYQMWGVSPDVGDFMGRAMATLQQADGD